MPYGLGAGAVDVALNNFVAIHYEAKHMSWLHCFWGVGASMGPYIMGLFLTGNGEWHKGYSTIGILQIVLTLILICSLPMWKKVNDKSENGKLETKSISLIQIFKLPGGKEVMFSFFCYCALEATTGLWGASYMVMFKGIPAGVAARWASIFYIGITAGRFLSGFIAMKMKSKNIIRLGQILIIGGIIFLILPLPSIVICLGFIMIGVVCAPVYPMLIHETPNNFGAEVSQSIIGVQMASAYVGTTFMPPLFGLIVEHINIKLYPAYLVTFVFAMIIMVEKLNIRAMRKCK